MNQEIILFIRVAAECSVFLDPRDPGLSYEEILEVGKHLGWQAGEIGDNLQYAALQFWGRRILPNDTTQVFSREMPEYRNFDAFDFVVSELNTRVRADGAAKAQIERSIVVERAIAKDISRKDIEVAITYQIVNKTLTEKNGVLGFFHKSGERGLPSDQLRASGKTIPNERRARVYPIVKDVIERRSDGRSKHVEPLDAFADELERLGYGTFRLWWTQIVAELRQCDASSAPVSVVVLAAALVEGSLTFVVKHARKLSLGVFKSKDFDGDARTWKIDSLVTSAASGSDSAILDMQAKNRAEILIRSRQRIHAGRMLSEFPAGVPDLRPEEARDAKVTAELVVRCVLDWLRRFPPA